MNRIRVMIVEDHTIVRQGLHVLLDREPDIHVIAEAADGLQAIRLAKENQPDVVIMDANLPGISGLQATRTIISTCPRTQVLVLSMHDDSDYVFGMLRAGAKGYILKQSAASELASAVRSVSRGQSALHPSVARIVVEQVNRYEPSPQNEELTAREREILTFIAAGKTSKEIGDELSLSAKTVDNYRARILEKLGARNKVEAITLALQRGLVQMANLA